MVCVLYVGARLILLNRKSSRSEAALQELKEQFPQTSVDGVECDLQQFASVRTAAQNVKELLGSEGRSSTSRTLLSLVLDLAQA